MDIITPSSFIQKFIDWTLSHGIKVVVILLAAIVISRFSKIFIRRLTRKAINAQNDTDKKKREKTLVSIFSSTLRFVVWVVAAVIILPELGVNIGPLLAGAGLIGLAVGMGARRLIEDYIAGMFIVLENQYRVGDEVKLDAIEGVVKKITLRRTVLRDRLGVVHSIPNGQVKVSSNKSRNPKATKQK